MRTHQNAFKETMRLVSKLKRVCVCVCWEFEVTEIYSTKSRTSCFCSLAVTSAGLINLPSFTARRAGQEREVRRSFLPGLSQGGVEKHCTPNAHHDRQWRGHDTPVPAPVQTVKPICNPFRSTCAWLNMPLLLRLCGAVPMCETLEIPLTQTCPVFPFRSPAN